MKFPIFSNSLDEIPLNLPLQKGDFIFSLSHREKRFLLKPQLWIQFSKLKLT